MQGKPRYRSYATLRTKATSGTSFSCIVLLHSGTRWYLKVVHLKVCAATAWWSRLIGYCPQHSNPHVIVCAACERFRVLGFRFSVSVSDFGFLCLPLSVSLSLYLTPWFRVSGFGYADYVRSNGSVTVHLI